MCGIVGIIGNLTTKHTDVFRDLQLFNTVRGMDSTGMIKVKSGYKDGKTKPEVVIDKQIGLPDYLWLKNESKAFCYDGTVKAVPRALIGHNRAATVGAINRDNAHPFTFETIHGVHNGSLRHYYDLEGYGKHQTDSQCIFDTIEKRGIDHTWNNFWGAAALVWYNEEDQTVNIIRNKERPLWYATSEDEDVLYFASEYKMIDLATHRNKFKLKKDKRGFTFFPFEEDTFYKFKISVNNYELVEERKLKKKSLYPTGTNTKTGGVKPGGMVGFKNHSMKVENLSNKTGLNQGWTSKFSMRADKQNRGAKISISHSTDQGKLFYGRVIKTHENMIKDEIVKIYPGNTDEVTALFRAISSGNRTFKLKHRPRLSIVGGETVWGVSASGLKQLIQAPVVNKTFDQAPKDKRGEDKPTPTNFVKTFQGVLISKEEWIKEMSSQINKCSCTWCGNPLSVDKANKYHYLCRGEALCESCAGDETILQNIAPYYGAYSQYGVI